MKTEVSFQVSPNETVTSKTELPRYEAPTITTYDDEELLEKLGPAQMAVLPS
jgi:hypothetical protein